MQHLSENTQKGAMTSINRRRDLAPSSYKMGKDTQKHSHDQTLQELQTLHLESAEWFDKWYHLSAGFVLF